MSSNHEIKNRRSSILLEQDRIDALIKVDLEAGAKYAELQKKYNVSPQRIRDVKYNKRLSKSPDYIKQKEQLAHKLYHNAHRIVDSITDVTINKASLQQRMTTVGISIDKARLLLDESTSNISIYSIHKEADKQMGLDSHEAPQDSAANGADCGSDTGTTVPQGGHGGG
jgi:hypothetical protein